MKKIFIKFSMPATLALAIALNSCNNAEEIKKQTEEQTSKIQTLVDEQLNGLQEQVNAECTALVDSLAGVQYEAFLAEAKKAGKKVVAKVKPKPVAKKEEPKVVDPKKDKMSGNQQTNVEEKKTKMSGGVDSSSVNKKKKKMSGN